MGLFAFFKKEKKHNPRLVDPYISTDVETGYSASVPVQTPRYPKCNCDGCPNQESCRYGHIIYDEIDKKRLSLTDKFIMLHAFDKFVPVGDYEDIATIEECRNQNQLIKLDEEKIIRTLNYLQEEKNLYLAVGKCGRAYYNSMNLGGILKFVEECLALKRRILKARNKA